MREPRRLPEALEPAEVAAFVADLETHRDRAMTLAMVQGGLRAAEVRGLLLADVDLGARRLGVVGKGSKERVVPVERAFFTEVVAYLRSERPPECSTLECFVVLRGPTRGQPLTEAGMRRISQTRWPAAEAGPVSDLHSHAILGLGPGATAATAREVGHGLHIDGQLCGGLAHLEHPEAVRSK